MQPHWLLRLTLAVALLGFWAAPALAQQGLTAEGEPGGPSVKDLTAEHELRGGLELLYDQVNNAATSGIVSQYNPDGSAAQNWDAIAADNFVVFEGTTWTVSEIFVRGFYSAGTPAGACEEVEVGIWSSAGTEPDAPLFVYDVAAPAGNDGAFTLGIPDTELEEGEYWLSAVCSGAGLVFDVPGENVTRWNWYYGPTAPIGAPAVLQNLGDGFGIPEGWNPLPSIGVAQQNLSFALFGMMDGEPPPPPPGPNFFADFEGVPTGALPKGWTRFNDGGVAATQWGAFAALGGTAMRSNWSSTVGAGNIAEDVLVTPAINLGPDAELSFIAAKSFTGDWFSEYEVLISTTTNEPGEFETIYEFFPDDIETTGNGGTVLTVDLSAYANQTVYLGFLHRQDDDGNTFVLDNVAITWSEITEEGPFASFNPNVETGLVIETEVGDPASGTITITNIGDEPLSYVFSDYAEPVLRGGTVLLSEDFEGAFPPGDWNTTDATGECPWLSSDDYELPGWTGTARGAAIDSDACGSGVTADASLISPEMDLSGVSGTMLDFDFAYRHLGSSSTSLDVSTDGGSSWTTVQSWTANFAYPDAASLPVSIDLSAYDGESSVTLRWRYQSGWDWWAFVDNVTVTAGEVGSFVTAVNPAAGTIAPGASQAVTVSVNPGGRPAGTYEDVLVIETNEDNGSYEYPVTLVVTPQSAPQAEVDPTELSFSINMDETDSATLTLSNTAADGAMDLEYNVSVVMARPATPVGGVVADAGADALRTGGVEGGPFEQTHQPVAPASSRGGEELMEDGGFEAGTPNPFWTEASSTFGTPLCTVADCGLGGGSGPNSGTWWTWFGGASGPETGSVEQAVVIPSGGAELSFFLEIPSVAAGATGFMRVLIDDTEVFEVLHTDAAAYGTYQQVVLDVSAFADGGVHNVRFESTTSGGTVNFFLDDVSLVSTTAPVVSVSPSAGSIAPGESEELTVSVDATDLEPGVYEYEILIATNDPAQPLLTVDVTLEVLEVSSEDGATVRSFALVQNYPNPFSGATTIRFELPENAPVTLDVFDVTGRRVATLVDGELEAGRHDIVWQANGLASGTYLYRIQAGSFSQTLRAQIVR